MQSIDRILSIELPDHQSAFLWGPRKTGKSTLLRARFPQSLRFDLLQSELVIQFSSRPALFRERVLARTARELAHPIIVDEVQKVPQLLDEVHWLIETRGLRFVLCGSSARKLKRGKANLLGGRAWRYELFPLVSAEIGAVDAVDLLRVLNQGTIPSHYLSPHYRRSLDAYLRDYLKEEVFDEGLTRNVGAFSRFFEAMGYSHGELTNYSNIARDCGVDSKTVKEYYQILCDTLLGRTVAPYRRRQSRAVITRTPKFYLFDVGVAGALTKRRIPEPRGEAFGRAFEHFIVTEVFAHASYTELDYDIHFWRTRSGLEVDLVLGPGEVALEIKGSQQVEQHALRPLRAFSAEHRPRRAIVVCNEPAPRVVDGIELLPWHSFLAELWAGRIVS